MGTEDKPAGVRDGETFDTGKMEAFIKGCLPDLRGALEVKQFPSGFSNLLQPLCTRPFTCQDFSNSLTSFKVFLLVK